MMSTNNILARLGETDSRPQDIVLGLYYVSLEGKGGNGLPGLWFD